MWALTEMIRASHSSTRIGRFDVSDHFPLLGFHCLDRGMVPDLMVFCVAGGWLL